MSAAAPESWPGDKKSNAKRPDPIRVETLFHEAAELSGPEQLAFLQGACGEDGLLLETVLHLLSSSSEAEAVWDRSAIELEARHAAFDLSPACNGQLFGPYRIVRRIAAGGMGLVYEGLRDDDEFHKRVALKFVQQDSGNPALAENFRSERQILAQLEHPYIARLLDGGSTDAGVPYLVMEYVDGAPIDHFVIDRRLPRAERLQLFLRVCDAVQYAHRNLVVHRDLKPANILVTDDGTPRLLDFGIAKLMTAEGTGQTTTIRALTPEYASPEQLAGRSITTASDVYSLGVLLFVLLAERLPYQAGPAQPAALVRAICEDEPVWKPAGMIDGELESVLSQALRKEPERRYLSVEQFAADLRRYLEGRPVAARPNTLFYRARKLAARRAIPLAIAAALVLSVLAGLAVSIFEARSASRQHLIAERRFDEARRLAYAVIHEIQPKLAAINGTVALRKTLIEETLVYLERLSKDAADSPALMRELLDSYSALAEVAADAGTANVGDHERAAQSLRQGQKLADTLERVDRASPASASSLIRFHITAARHLIDYESQQSAKNHAEHALEIAERMVGQNPSDRDARFGLASAASAVANALGNATFDSEEDLKRKIALFERSLGIWKDLAQEHPANEGELKKRIALMEKSLSSVLANQGNYARALEYARQAAELDRQKLELTPSSPVAQMDLAFDIGSIGYIYLQMQDYPKAVENMRQNVALRDKVATANPDDRRATDRLAFALGDLVKAEALMGDTSNSRRDLLRTIGLYQKLAAAGPLVPQSLGRFALQAYDAGEMERQRGNKPEGCLWYRKSVALLDEYQRRANVPAGTPEEVDRVRRAAQSCAP
jgi:tetratricopeptide (TPR) repeat protein